MNIDQLYREVILDHASNPRNKLFNQDVKDYKQKRGYNPSCGDDIVIFIKFNNNQIEDIIHHAQGCSISVAATSICSVALKGIDINLAKTKIENYLNMVQGNNYDNSLFSRDELAFSGIKNFPARVKCASLAWKTVLELINEL